MVGQELPMPTDAQHGLLIDELMKHWPTLVFIDGDIGDLCRCDCGDQGFDFHHGREWFSEHVLEKIR